MPCWWDAVDRETYGAKKHKGAQVTEPRQYEHSKTWRLPNGGFIKEEWTWAGAPKRLAEFLKRLKK